MSKTTQPAQTSLRSRRQGQNCTSRRPVVVYAAARGLCFEEVSNGASGRLTIAWTPCRKAKTIEERCMGQPGGWVIPLTKPGMPEKA